MEECTELQKKLRASEDMVQSLQQELSSSKRIIQLLRDDLQRSEDSVESLKEELKEKEERNHVLTQRLHNAQESTKFVQNDLDAFKCRSHTLQKQLNAAEEQNRALQEALMACEARVQEAEREKQQKVEHEEECTKVKSTSSLLQSLNTWLDIILDELQGGLKMSLEKKESLKRTIGNAKAKNMAEVEELQHNIAKVKEKLREMERKHDTESKWTN